jgi:dTDP-4-dehydrorhamnose reductase
MLGTDLLQALSQRGHEPIGVDIEDMDITDPDATMRVITEYRPDALIHCAAYTAVDKAEDNEELCRKVNFNGSQNVALACQALDIPMLCISTDYVFDGSGERPWEPEDEPHPLSVYGQTKYEGEKAVRECLTKYFIVRITWLFGLHGPNFVKAILAKAQKDGVLNVVNDQFGSPTYTKDLCKLLVDMIETDKYGIYHVNNEGICSWYDFAKEIIARSGIEAQVNPVDSATYAAKAPRPKNSRMSKRALDQNEFERLPMWQDALERFFRELRGST